MERQTAVRRIVIIIINIYHDRMHISHRSVMVN